MNCNENNQMHCDMNMDCMHCDKANCTLRQYDYDKMGKDVDLITTLPEQELYSIFRKRMEKEEVLIYESE